ncbi:MAG: extracellular solute-binding protein [bacterium]|nr:extracellular solute-binding protein [bacterium]
MRPAFLCTKKRGVFNGAVYLKYPLTLFLLPLFILVVNCGQKKSEPPAAIEKVSLKIHAWDGYAREYEAELKKHMLSRNLDVEFIITTTSGFDSFVEAVRNKGVHLICPANDLLKPLTDLKLLKPLDCNKIPVIKQLNPNILAKNVHKIDDVVYSVPFNFGPYAIAYNKDKMPPPQSYKVLWDPGYRKRVTISGSYDTINIYMTALMLGMPRKALFNLTDSQLSRVEEKLTELFKLQVAEFWEENLNPANHTKFDVGMDWGIGVRRINKEYGGNWGYCIPDEGVTGWVDTWAITVNTKDPLTEKAAYAFINYMIRPRVQAKMARITSYAPTNIYAGRFLDAGERKRHYLNDPKHIERFTLWQPLDAPVMKRYRETWKRAREKAK